MPFGEELVHYFVGAATCAVPGRSRRGSTSCGAGPGRCPGRGSWSRLCGSRGPGLAMPPAHAKCLAMLAPVMTLREGGRIYSPGGRLLEAGDRLDQPGLVAALEVVAAEGARTFYEGTLAESLLGADGGARRPRHPGGPGRLPGRVGGARRGGVRGRPRADAGRPLAAHGHAGRLPPASRRLGRGPRSRPGAPARGAALQRQDLRAHDEPLRRRRGRKRVRDHDEPRARLGRLPARLRRPPQQHARGVRPPGRPARARQADGEHDVADGRARRRRARARGRRGRRHAPPPRPRAGALGHPRRGPRPLRRRSSGRGSTRPARSSTSSPASRTARSRRSSPTASTSASGTSSTTTSAGVSVVAGTGAAADPRRSGLALTL